MSWQCIIIACLTCGSAKNKILSKRRKHLNLRIWLFVMAAMAFPCNGILLIQGNLPRSIQVVFQIYWNIMLVFLYPISIVNNYH